MAARQHPAIAVDIQYQYRPSRILDNRSLGNLK
jgi:hypothetical protein